MSTLLDAHVKGSLPSGLPASTLLNPSAPQQIYLNLLILEASLRSQYLSLTLRRRKYTFFFLLLILWTAYFTHALFIHGPSPYYYISLLQKLALGAGVMTLAIFWLSGLHKKTLVFPRKFVGNTNKGLRQFNIKLVSVPLTPGERVVGWLVIFPVVKYIWPWCPALPYIPPGELEIEKGRSFGEVLRGFLKHGHHGPPNPAHALPPPPPPQSPLPPPLPPHAQTPGRKRRLSQASRMTTPSFDNSTLPSADEEPLQPSGSHVKLVILPKGFSPDFREGWEIYRTDYWEKENERRAALRKQIRSRQSLFNRIFSPTPCAISIPTTTTTPSTSTTTTRHHLHHHHLRDHSSSRRGTPEPPISRSATPTPNPDLDTPTPATTTDDTPPRRPRRSSTASLTRPHRRSTSLATAGGTPTPPPVMAPLTPLRAELLVDEAGEVSDAGSVRSLAGSVGTGGGGGEGASGKGRRGGRKTRGGKRKGGKGESGAGAGAGTGTGGAGSSGKGEGSIPATPA